MTSYLTSWDRYAADVSWDENNLEKLILIELVSKTGTQDSQERYAQDVFIHLLMGIMES